MTLPRSSAALLVEAEVEKVLRIIPDPQLINIVNDGKRRLSVDCTLAVDAH